MVERGLLLQLSAPRGLENSTKEGTVLEMVPALWLCPTNKPSSLGPSSVDTGHVHFKTILAANSRFSFSLKARRPLSLCIRINTHKVTASVPGQLLHPCDYGHWSAQEYLGIPSCLACAKALSRVWLFCNPWTLATSLLFPWDFPGKNTGSGLPFPPPGDLPDPGIETVSPALQADSLLLSHLGSQRIQK